MISKSVKFLLGYFKRDNTALAGIPEDLLFVRRLKRTLNEPVGARSGSAKNLAGKIFIAGLAFVFVMAPWRVAFAAPFLTLSSFSGNPATIQVSGGGFTSGETVSIYFNDTSGQPVATALVGQDSLFKPVAVVIPPNAPQGPLQIIGIGSQSKQQQANSYFVVPFNPSISVASTANTPGSVIEVSGAGFAPNETVNLTFDTVAAGSVRVDTKGNFVKKSVTVPQLSGNTYLIHAKGANSNAETVAYFYVGGFYPTASPDSYFLMPGDSLTFSGGGFAPGESVQVFAGQGETAVSTINVGAAGNFVNAGSVSIPANAPGGVITYTLKSSATDVSLPLMVTIGSFTSLVTPDNYFVGPGQSVKFYGKGFAPNEQVQVFEGQNAQAITVIKADKGGGFAGSGTTTLPFSAAGSTVTFKFVGQQSQTSASVDVTVGTLNPQINPSEYYLTPGKSFTVWGTGFAPAEKVDVTAAGATATVATDEFGVFKTSGPFTAPFTQNSQISVQVTGKTSGAVASLNLSVGSLSPLVTPDSYYVTPGDLINLSGSGFAPNEDINIFSGQDSLGAVAADKFGNFTNKLVTTPFGGGQTLNYTFTGAKSGASVNLSVTIAQLFPVVTLDNYYTVPGSTIQAMASGFSRGEPVTISISGGGDTLTTTADKNGVTPWVPITLPLNLLDKSLDITFTGTATGVSGKSTVSLAPFNPLVSPDTWYTNPGTRVNFSGSGFAPRENVAVTLNGNSVGSAIASSTGEFVFGHTIPVTAGSAHYLFSGDKTGATASVDISLAPFSPQISPSTYYAAPGSKIVFTGNGFAPGETVDISFNNSSVDKVTTDAKGGFTSSGLSIPFGTANAHFTFASSVTNINQSLDIGVAQLNAGIELSTYYNTGGAPLAVTGMGFGGGEKVDVTFDNNHLGTATSDVKGNFVLKSTVPFGPAGSHTVTAKGQASGAVSSASFTQAQVYTNVQLGSYAGAPGDAVTFIGSGFLPDEPVNITTDRTGDSVVHTFVADAKGNFKNSGYIVPKTFTGGPLSLTITGTHSASATNITYYVTGP